MALQALLVTKQKYFPKLKEVSPGAEYLEADGLVQGVAGPHHGPGQVVARSHARHHDLIVVKTGAP